MLRGGGGVAEPRSICVCSCVCKFTHYRYVNRKKCGCVFVCCLNFHNEKILRKNRLVWEEVAGWEVWYMCTCTHMSIHVFVYTCVCVHVCKFTRSNQKKKQVGIRGSGRRRDCEGCGAAIPCMGLLTARRSGTRHICLRAYVWVCVYVCARARGRLPYIYINIY